jgi:microcystin-dependent protein
LVIQQEAILAFNGSGTHVRVHDWTTDLANTIPVTASRMDADSDDFSASLSNTICRDGQSTATARIPFAAGVSAVAGSASAAAYAQSGDLNTGLYFPATDQWGLAAGGVAVVTGTATGMSVTGTHAVSGNATVGGTFAATGAITHFGQPIVPVGSVINFAGTSAPSGWLLCFGQAISRATYSALFAVLGTTYGAGDGSTTFNLPDLRGRVIAGKDDMGGTSANRLTNVSGSLDGDVLGASGGAENRTLLTANLPPYTPAGTVGITDPGHNHTIPYQSSGSGFQTAGGGTTPITGTMSTSTAVTSITASFTGSPQGGTSTAFGIVQPTIILNKIIYTGVYS